MSLADKTIEGTTTFMMDSRKDAGRGMTSAGVCWVP
jgi:hypothetical protein